MIYVIILTIAITISAYLLYEKIRRDKRLTIPFKESMDLLSMPIITFENNGAKLHFLLDTGSNNSLIDIDCLEKFTVTSLSKQFDEAFEGKIKVHGIIGSKFLRRNKCILDFEKLAVYYNPKK